MNVKILILNQLKSLKLKTHILKKVRKENKVVENTNTEIFGIII